MLFMILSTVLFTVLSTVLSTMLFPVLSMAPSTMLSTVFLTMLFTALATVLKHPQSSGQYVRPGVRRAMWLVVCVNSHHLKSVHLVRVGQIAPSPETIHQ